MKQIILIILDGWGEGEPTIANPLTKTNLSTFKEIERFYPKTLLGASGISVGLLWGEPGNSESGHLSLGAGRIIYQHLPRILLSIREGSFFTNQALLKAARHVKTNFSRLHIMGLLSSGSVHAYSDELYALLEFAKQQGLSDRTFIHVFTDGRDAPPKEGKKMVTELETRAREEGLGRIGTIMGRKYAMNRNAEWELTRTAYELLTQGKGERIASASEHLSVSYANGLTDEYVKPALVLGRTGGLTTLAGSDPARVPFIQDNDAVVFWNYREDSARQLTKAFVLENFKEFPRKKITNLFFVTMTEYERELAVEVAFRPIKILNPLARVISEAGLKQLHTAETEKYAHVTYFFNGLKEKPFPGEDRVLVPSPKVKSFAETPEMRTNDIALKVVEALRLERYPFILANFANADMVAHTGDFDAAIRAAEAVNEALKHIKDAALEHDATLVITADHGNIEYMRNVNTGEVITEHTINPVPFYLVGKEFKGGKFPEPNPQEESKTVGILADVAPTVLELLDIEKPADMTGQSLLELLDS